MIEETELLAQIQTRGYVHVVIHPTRFVEVRLAREKLFEVVQKCSVSFRGWDYPHIDSEPPHIDHDWVGQSYRWEHQLELWRFYRSGQFVSVSGLPYEWRDRSGFWPTDASWKPNSVLGMMEVVATSTEAVEFASRLSQTDAGGDQMKVSVRLEKMNGRLLFVDSPRRASLFREYRASVDSIPVEVELGRSELVARSREVALELSREVFSYFGFSAEPRLLADMQREFIANW